METRNIIIILWISIVGLHTAVFDDKARTSSTSVSKKGGKGKKGSKGGSISRPKSTGNSTIDAFVTDSYDLNDKIVDLKGTLKEVSKGLKESNAILSSINSHPDGPLGWASAELAKDSLSTLYLLKQGWRQ